MRFLVTYITTDKLVKQIIIDADSFSTIANNYKDIIFEDCGDDDVDLQAIERIR